MAAMVAMISLHGHRGGVLILIACGAKVADIRDQKQVAKHIYVEFEFGYCTLRRYSLIVVFRIYSVAIRILPCSVFSKTTIWSDISI